MGGKEKKEGRLPAPRRPADPARAPRPLRAVFKLLEIMGMGDEARGIVPSGGLKSRAKVYELDAIWKNIVGAVDRDWPFIPTTFL